MQSIVLAVSLGLMASIAAAFAGVIASSQSGSPAQKPKSAETYRSRLLVGLLVLGGLVTLGSLRPWPHALAAGPVVHVKATGSQWSWDITPQKVPVGQPVVFSVATTDVTHGFGVYDPSGRILFQTQAMPGYVNQVSHTFDKPGTYKILCMEYCGLAHHNMVEDLIVEAR